MLGLGLGLGLGDPLVLGVGDDAVGLGDAEVLLTGLVPGLGLRLVLGEELLGSLLGVAVALALDVGARVAAGLGPGAAIDADRTSVVTHPCGAAPRTAAVSLAAQGFTGGGEVGWLARSMPTMPDETREIPTTTLNAGFVARCVLMG